MQVYMTYMGLLGSHDVPTSKGALSLSHPLAAGDVTVSAVAAGVACNVVAVRQTRKRSFLDTSHNTS
jgi:hypothetical protein